MFRPAHSIRATLLGIALAFSCISPAWSDDSEIYVNAATSTSAVKPNILLIVDTSISMRDSDITGERARYNAGTTYTTANNCTSGRIFFRAEGAAMPDCTSNDYILTSSNHCAKLTAANTGPSGRWSGKTAQWSTPTLAWGNLQPSGTANEVECFADNGVHGHNTSNTNTRKWARNGDASNKWTAAPSDTIAWSSRITYTFYSSNWMNWYRVTPATTTRTRIGVAQDAVVDMVSSVDDINMGMMRFNISDGGSGDAQYTGGMVTNRIEDITTGRAALVSRVLTGDNSNGYGGNAATMLSETLYEAKRYWAGEASWHGRQEGAYNSSSNIYGYDPNAFVGATDVYSSPITHTCQRNFNIILTDGAPTFDTEAEANIIALTGSCDAPNPGDTGISTAASGRCLDDLAGWLNRPTTDLRPPATGIDGNQNVQTYVIAFGADVNSSTPTATFLQDVATQGGGTAYNAANSDELQDVFTNITNQVLNVGTTFSTASVSVNAFNRTASRNELYFAVFSPQDRLRWDGNLKKYKLTPFDPDGAGSAPVQLQITGTNTATSAIDPSTGLFRDTAQSFWSTVTDGNQVTAGGAASLLPNPSPRVVLTHIGSNPAGTPASLTEIDALTTTVQDAQFGTTSTSDPSTTDVREFAYATDEKRMGDPLHSSPAVVTFGGTAAAPVDTVYVATNDGYLHAINASTGVEKWSFVPQELLGRLKNLQINPAATNRSYGLDGDIRVLKLDKDNDGVIEPADGDVVWVFFGMRRGGSYYYALDVTANSTAPKLMWKIGPSELPGIGETWSPPTVDRVNVGGATQNNQKLVLIFGGGYDPIEENYAQTNDTSGHRIFMVDAKSGTLLWYAGASTGVAGTTAQQLVRMDTNSSIEKMKNSIPGRISVLDTDGDQYADRMYAADLGGRIWRFDITNGNSAKTLVTGGVFASLGGAEAPTSIADTRRFYNAPDVALIKRNGLAPYYNLAIGSGYRGHPLHTETTDRFYSLRDKQAFSSLTQAQFNTMSASPILDGDSLLIDMTSGTNTVGLTAKGWKRSLPNLGEKNLSEATTGGTSIMFTTYQPITPTTECQPVHRNRVYALNIDDGKAAQNLNSANDTTTNPNNLDNTDISLILDDTSGITGEVRVAATRGLLEGDLDGDGDNDADDERIRRDRDDDALCIAGRQILGKCIAFDDAVRTYWRREADAGQ
ncbi:MAG TPA: PilC/PilY family type IV pilus protein [Steroidobacteraceae bacterium]|jgi:type IV pilus assembly protein PilY1|nr:PilC/PilY family type IV pilus protein [Steroidobacteraceae bacterium]